MIDRIMESVGFDQTDRIVMDTLMRFGGVEDIQTALRFMVKAWRVESSRLPLSDHLFTWYEEADTPRRNATVTYLSAAVFSAFLRKAGLSPAERLYVVNILDSMRHKADEQDIVNMIMAFALADSPDKIVQAVHVWRYCNA